MANTVHGPKPTATQLVSGEMRIGAKMLEAPMPLVGIAGFGLSPQNQRLPSDCIATVSRMPAQTFTQLVTEPTGIAS